MMEALKALSEARTAMVGVHGQLDEAKLRLGIRTKMGYENKMAQPQEAQVVMREVG